jgi:hypothetical protein
MTFVEELFRLKNKPQSYGISEGRPWIKKDSGIVYYSGTIDDLEAEFSQKYPDSSFPIRVKKSRAGQKRIDPSFEFYQSDTPRTDRTEKVRYSSDGNFMVTDVPFIDEECEWMRNITASSLVVKRQGIDSSSATVQAYTRYYFYKIAFEAKNIDKDNSLLVEANIYENVTNPMLDSRMTPHIVRLIGRHSCPYNAKSISASFPLLYAELEFLRRKSTVRENYDNTTLNVIIMEKLSDSGISFYDFNHQNPESSQWLPVLFQIIYTLQCFVHVGLQHNDLHANNIWIDVLDHPIFFQYDVYGLKFGFFTRYKVKIFDFDFATKHATPQNGLQYHNTGLDGYICERYGRCNDWNEKTDIFRLLYGLYNSKTMKSFSIKYAKTHPPECGSESVTVSRCIASTGALCYRESNTYNTSACVLEDPPDISTPLEILHGDDFSTFRVDSFNNEVEIFSILNKG